MPENIQDINFEEVDLLAEMAKATEYKPEVNVLQIEASTTADTNTDEFEPPPPGEDTNDTNATGDADANNINAEDLTDLIIDASDMVLESVLPFLYKKSLSISKDDLKVMNEIKAIYRKAKETKTKVLEFNARQQEVMDVYIDYDDYCEDLPLTTKEKKNLREPLRKVLANVNFKASPENALMAVAAMILLPRLLPIITNKFSKK